MLEDVFHARSSKNGGIAMVLRAVTDGRQSRDSETQRAACHQMKRENENGKAVSSSIISALLCFVRF